MATLTLFIVIAFVIGYLCIALESVTKINKAAIALLMCVVCWDFADGKSRYVFIRRLQAMV
jgi:sodium/proton antiporter, NhaD family (TC 2.A.62)